MNWFFESNLIPILLILGVTILLIIEFAVRRGWIDVSAKENKMLDTTKPKEAITKARNIYSTVQRWSSAFRQWQSRREQQDHQRRVQLLGSLHTPEQPSNITVTTDHPIENAEDRETNSSVLTHSTILEKIQRLPKVLPYTRFPFTNKSFELPLGISTDGKACSTDLIDGAVHIGLFGTSRCGKDNLLRVWFTALTQRHTPEELKIAVLDGKGDWINSQIDDVAHLWMPVIDAVEDKQLDLALEKLVKELELRRSIIAQHRCANVRDYNKITGVDPLPKLVVIFTDVADKLDSAIEKKLNTLFSKAAAYDIHLIASFQSPSGCSTLWRNNLSLTICGKLGQASQDAPAMGCAPSDLLIRPSNLPSVAGENKRRGIFLVKPDDKQFVVQTPLLDQADFIEYCDRLPTQIGNQYVLPGNSPFQGNNTYQYTIRTSVSEHIEEDRDNIALDTPDTDSTSWRQQVIERAVDEGLKNETIYRIVKGNRNAVIDIANTYRKTKE